MHSQDLEQRYKQLVESLQPYAAAWNQSILHFWPSCRDALPRDFWEPLLDRPLSSLHAIDTYISRGVSDAEPKDLPPALADFLRRVGPSLSFPRTPFHEALNEAQGLRMSAKKKQEIAAILPFLREKRGALAWHHGVDIGGGVGHLARTLMQQLDLPMVTIDRDAVLQSLGRELLAKQGGPDDLTFVLSDVKDEEQDIDARFAGSCLSLGLHTCGPLAWSHLGKSRRSQSLLNFGCCYDRMNVAIDCQRSAFAQKHSLPFTSFSLFLATRGRCRTLPELERQERVNTFRMALHLFIQEEGLAAGFVTVGDASKAAYDAGFAAYAQDRFRALGWDTADLDRRATAFVAKTDVQRSMREFFLLNVVRNAFARPLEVLLLLDRALWLKEQGRTACLLQFFEPDISPRNLGIFSSL